ncbi:DNA polymerase III subunit gamma/tau [Virgibacillus sp. W0430]|uniref:DNA polymerase III subunit gamma/tau n=1 Tax=Virgibacillus sp. W0430 TaxID=3391580 RepID=UPI003F47BF60
MGYQALYRVWRPRKFADVVGQSHITRTLQNAISQNKFSHAYLFSGPRGTGKTSAAKIFAQTINCEQAPTAEPCNECAACRGILDGSISDVIEIDAASNTSVDDIREIRDKVKYASSAVPYKVYIIDEVHMISVNAFNALLKTLEEPPAHVVFILATTEPHKIPLTIISRCQRFDFKPIGNNAIIDRLKCIVESEGFAVTEKALEAVALTAEGGMRDALSILDQAISYSTDQIDLDDVLAVTGGVSQTVLTRIIQAMHERNVQQTLQLFEEMIQHGKDPGRFVYDLIYFLRDVLFYKAAPALSNQLERAVLDAEFKEVSDQVSNTWLQQAIFQLNDCLQEIKWINNPRVFIEIVLLGITSQNEQQEPTEKNEAVVDNKAITHLTDRLEQLERQLQSLQQAPKNPTQQPRRQASKQPTKSSYKVPFEQIRRVLEGAEKQALQHVQSTWANFLTQLKSTNAPAHATIQDSKPAAASDEGLVVAFKYEIHCSLFLDNRETVESVLATVLGKRITIYPLPEENWQQLRSEYLNKQEQSASTEERQGDSLIDEARKLVGDDLLEIHE